MIQEDETGVSKDLNTSGAFTLVVRSKSGSSSAKTFGYISQAQVQTQKLYPLNKGLNILLLIALQSETQHGTVGRKTVFHTIMVKFCN